MASDSFARVGPRALRVSVLLLGMAFGLPQRSAAQMPGMPEQKEMMAWGRTLFVLADQLEYSPGGRARPIDIEMRAWYGGVYRRVWLRGQGEFATTGRDADGEVEILYGRLVDPFWDAVIGVHVDQHWEGTIPTRTLLAVGFVGLAPYRLELEPTLYVSQRGEVSGRLEIGFPLLLTQRLIIEPEMELNAYLQAVPRYRARRGLNDYETGVRIRYEFRREFAPYIGWSRSRRIGVGSERSEAAQTRFVSGLRLWY